MNLELKPVLPQISETEIEIIESLLGTTLPLDYRNFILKFNGGIPNKHYFGDKSVGTIHQIEAFYGFSLRSDSDFAMCTNEYESMNYNILYLHKDKIRAKSRILGKYKQNYVSLRNEIEGAPSCLLNIAANGWGDHQLLDINSSNKGRIYDYLHDDGEIWNEDEELELEYMTSSPSFDSVINHHYEEWP